MLFGNRIALQTLLLERENDALQKLGLAEKTWAFYYETSNNELLDSCTITDKYYSCTCTVTN